MSYSKIIDVCRDLLLNFPNAKQVQDYIDNRISREAQDKFSLGYFPSVEYLYLLTDIIDRFLLEELNLLYYKQNRDGLSVIKEIHSQFESHNLIMPYRNVYGDTIGIVGRRLCSDENITKYKNTEFAKGKHLFGLYEAKHSIIDNDCVYIVEGQFDCISAHSRCLNNFVALGSSSMTADQLSLVLRYTENIILLLDNDAAGIAGMNKIVEHFDKYANIKIGKIPEQYKDIDEYLRENKNDKFEI
jgi:DNA primase